MRNHSFPLILAVGVILGICIPGVIADIPDPATPETQGFSTFTDVDATGTATENDEFTWQMSSTVLDDTLSGPGNAINIGPYILILHNILPLLFPETSGEVQYTVAYSEDTIADQGDVSYTKQSSLDTSNQVANMENFRSSRILAFSGSGLGLVSTREDLVVDGAGSYGLSEDLFLCPFAAGSSGLLPKFCSIVEVGSDAALTQGILATSIGERHVAATADAPVTVDYSIQAGGAGDAYAEGSVTSGMNAHIQEGAPPIHLLTFGYPGGGRIDLYSQSGDTMSDLTYTERTTASGIILRYEKTFSYESGVRRL